MSRNTEDLHWDTYRADYKLGHFPIRSCISVTRDLRSHTWQIWMIFKSGFLATFRQTAIGVVWGFIMPLVPLLAFFFLTILRVFPEHESIQPLSYMAVGVTLWLYLQGLIMAPTLAVENHASVLKSSGFPIVCIFMASYGKHAFEMLMRIVVVVPMLLAFYDMSLKGLAVLLVLLLPATAFCVAFGILLGLAGIVLRDLKNVADIFFRYMIFISFAIFPLSLAGVGWWVYTLNPFAIFIDNMRTALIFGHLSTPSHFYIASALSIVLLVLALHLYNVLERRIAGAL